MPWTLMEALEKLSHAIAHGPTMLLVTCWLWALSRARLGMWQMAAMAFPGTVCHELAHFVAGMVFFASPTSLSVLPTRKAGGYRMGQVTFRRLGVLNGLFVSLAPLVLVPLAILLISWSIGAYGRQTYLSWFASGTLAANLLFAATPSPTDLRAGLPSMLFYALLLGVVWLLAS